MINLVGIGQSNMADFYDWGAMQQIAEQVSRDIGQQVNLVGGKNLTAFPGTTQLDGGYSTVPAWITQNADGSFTAAGIQASVDAYLKTVPAGPTVVFYLHNESLSTNNAASVQDVKNLLTWQKADFEAALNRPVTYAMGFVPYNFAVAPSGTGGFQTLGITSMNVRLAEEQFAADPANNAVTIGTTAVDMTGSWASDGTPTTTAPGGQHYSQADVQALLPGIVAALDHQLAQYAMPGSRVANGHFDWQGPTALSASLVNQHHVNVKLHAPYGLQPLSALAQQGAGWAVENSDGSIIYADQAKLIGHTERLTFLAPISSGSHLVYGNPTDGRISLPNGGAGLGSGVYDSNDLLLQLPAAGLTILPQHQVVGALPTLAPQTSATLAAIPPSFR